MSFVQNLRMRNMFPINSDLGSAKVDLSGQDPMYEIINEFRRLQGQEQPGNGMRQVASMQRNEQPESLRFGGVVGGSNPGADILERSKRSAEQTYANYNKPQNTQNVSGMSNDEAHLNRYFDRKNKETVANATAANAGMKGWKTVNVTDPDDPSRTIAMQINDNTGEKRPIDLNGAQITNKTTPQALEKMNQERGRKAQARENIKSKAQSSLDLLSELLDPKTDKLTPDAEWATGGSAILGKIPLPTPAYKGASKLNQLSKSRVLDLIGEMKAQSATGATGFGQMNIKELTTLQDAATILERPGLDEETIRQELIKIKGILNRALTDNPNESTDTNEIRPAVSHGAGTNGTGGRIRVRNKLTGQTGTVSEGAFNPQKYDRVQ